MARGRKVAQASCSHSKLSLSWIFFSRPLTKAVSKDTRKHTFTWTDKLIDSHTEWTVNMQAHNSHKNAYTECSGFSLWWVVWKAVARPPEPFNRGGGDLLVILQALQQDQKTCYGEGSSLTIYPVQDHFQTVWLVFRCAQMFLIHLILSYVQIWRHSRPHRI